CWIHELDWLDRRGRSAGRDRRGKRALRHERKHQRELGDLSAGRWVVAVWNSPSHAIVGIDRRRRRKRIIVDDQLNARRSAASNSSFLGPLIASSARSRSLSS